MEEQKFNNKDFDITEVNNEIVRFTCGFLTQFQEVLTDREKEVLKYVFAGRSRKWVCLNCDMSGERVRQIVYNGIKKVQAAHGDVVRKLEMSEQENMELKHKVFFLEQELKKVNAADKDKMLSKDAVRMLNTDVKHLPLSTRAIYSLLFANARYFKDVPLLTSSQLQCVRSCGKKTINEITGYLDRFKLKLGMSYEDVVSTFVELPEEVFSSEDDHIVGQGV